MALAPVQYEFEPVNGGRFTVRRLYLTEGLSEPYVCQLDVVQWATEVDLDSLLGSSCVVIASRAGGTERRICGVIRRAIKVSQVREQVMLRLDIVPALWALGQSTSSRMFQNMTAPDILKKVLSEGLQPYQRKVRFDLQRSDYAQREYCAQYQETDYDFVQRLMQEEGIAFYFDHSGDEEELVLFDDNATLAACQTAGGGSIEYAKSDIAYEHETVHALEAAEQLNATSIILNEYDWKRPARVVHHEQHGQDQAGSERIVYDSAPALVIGDGGDDGAVRKRVRFEELVSTRWLGAGAGNCLGFEPGLVFELEGHGLAELDQKYVIVSAAHEGDAPGESSADVHSAVEYHNQFTCIPAGVLFRPARTHRRPALGMQTATVVGPAGEEVYTDEHGRVKVQFHWDRDGRSDENSSCWVRVAQAWAGPGYGAFFLPRIGMEVVIQFLEGDPDLPYVVGCLHNGRNLTPFKLPDDKTKSGWVTHSSLNAMGSNEIVFEDAAGNEEIQLKAEKDWNIVVKNDQTETVKHDSTRTVEHDDINTIKNDHTETIEGNDTLSVKKDRSLTVGGNETTQIDGNRSLSVKKNETISVDGDRNDTVSGNATTTIEKSSTTEITKDLSVTVGKDMSLSVSGKHSIDVSGDVKEDYAKELTVDVGKNAVVSVGKNLEALVSQAITLKADKTLTLKCGSASIIIKQDGKIQIKGSNIEVSGSGNLKVKGSKVAMN